MRVQAIAMTCTRRLVRVGKETRSARFLFEPCSSPLSLSVDLTIIHYFNTSFIVFLSRSQLDRL